MIFSKVYKASDGFSLDEILCNGLKPFLVNVYFRELTSFDKQKKTMFIESLRERYTDSIVNFINQRLLEDYFACIECFYIDAEKCEVSFAYTKYRKNMHLYNPELDFLCVSTHFDSESRYEDAFSIIDAKLNKYSHSFDNVIRQWNYIPDICYYKDGVYEYSKFNEVRKKYYAGLSEYPAATGIGIGGDTARIITLSLKSDCKITRLENSLQTPAFYYSNKIVDPNQEKPNCAKPLFARALLVECKDAKVLFISGTASIRGEESIADDVMTQLKVTIENMEDLINQSKIKKESIALKIYLKNNILADEVLSAVKKHFHSEDVFLVQADICRSELLVEIEAVIG